MVAGQVLHPKKVMITVTKYTKTDGVTMKMILWWVNRSMQPIPDDVIAGVAVND